MKRVNEWEDNAGLSAEDKRLLDEAMAEYETNPESLIPWEEVKAQIQAELRL